MSQSSKATLIISVDYDPPTTMFKRLSRTFTEKPPASQTADEQVRTRVAYTGQEDDTVQQHTSLQSEIWNVIKVDPHTLVPPSDVYDSIVDTLRKVGGKTENVMFVLPTDFAALDTKLGLDTSKVRSGGYLAYHLSDEQYTQLEKEMKGRKFTDWNPSFLGGLITVEGK